MIYELREYVAVPGAAERLHRRFADGTLELFSRHGLELAGFWQARDEPGRIVYLLRFNDEDERLQAWARFQADPDWKQLKADSEAEGPIVDEQISRVLVSTDYIDALAPAGAA